MNSRSYRKRFFFSPRRPEAWDLCTLAIKVLCRVHNRLAMHSTWVISETNFHTVFFLKIRVQSIPFRTQIPEWWSSFDSCRLKLCSLCDTNSCYTPRPFNSTYIINTLVQFNSITLLNNKKWQYPSQMIWISGFILLLSSISEVQILSSVYTFFMRQRERERVGQRELIISHAAENITVLFKHGKERDYGTNTRKASNNFINIIYRSVVKNIHHLFQRSHSVVYWFYTFTLLYI